jgi:hypothetical protein
LGKKSKVESVVLHGFFIDYDFGFRIQLLKNGMIIFQDAVDFPNIFAKAAQLFVVIRISAGIAAKFLVGSSP